MRCIAPLMILGLFFDWPSAAASADNSTPTTRQDQQISWSPITGMDHQLFPSATICTATSKVPFVYLLVKLSNVPAGSKIHVVARCESLMDESSADIVADKSDGTLMVPIKANWKFDRLVQVRQQIPADFVYSLSIDGQDLGEKTDTAIVHSINDCIYALRDGVGQMRPLFPLFAAYVNEDNPKIDQLLKSVLAARIVRQIDGYQENDPKQVLRQVFAVWYFLQQKGVKYSNITDIPDQSAALLAQHVRFLDESIDDAQANCVDGSVIFASVLQKIGIESGLVIKPGHMFVQFYSSPGRKEPFELETTFLGGKNLRPEPQDHSLVAALAPDILSRARISASSFVAALEEGQQEFASLQQAEDRQKGEQSKDFVGGVIYISDARKAGIMPLPYDFKNQSSDSKAP